MTRRSPTPPTSKAARPSRTTKKAIVSKTPAKKATPARTTARKSAAASAMVLSSAFEIMPLFDNRPCPRQDGRAQTEGQS